MGYKGRYASCRMTIYGTRTPLAGFAARRAARRGVLSEQAKERLKVFDWWHAHGKNVSRTARHFGFTRLTIRRWIRRVRLGPGALNDRSHRPHRLRTPTTPWHVVERVCALRKQYRAWSKYKLRTLLWREGIRVSVSTVGRILKRRGFIDPRRSRVRRRAALHPRRRFPKGMRITAPGGMVQMDVKHVMLPGGRRHYQFTAVDVLTKERVLERYSSESSRNAAAFLTVCLREFSARIAAVQTDNGPTFQKHFREACRRYRIPHYFIEPRHPKQNSYVEISHGADDREFYLQGNVYLNPDLQRQKLKEWQRVWNEFRPHQALGYLTPKEYLARFEKKEITDKDVVVLQA